MWASVQSPRWIGINRAGDKMEMRPGGYRLSDPMQNGDQMIRVMMMGRVRARKIDVAFRETLYPEIPMTVLLRDHLVYTFVRQVPGIRG